MWQRSSVSLQHLYLQNTSEGKSYKALYFTAQSESIHEIVENTYSTEVCKVKIDGEWSNVILTGCILIIVHPVYCL